MEYLRSFERLDPVVVDLNNLGLFPLKHILIHDAITKGSQGFVAEESQVNDPFSITIK